MIASRSRGFVVQQRRWLTALIALSAVASWSKSAEAQDQEPVFFGGQASLTAGSLTAFTEEADAIWYNPACLAAIHRNRVSLSGSNLTLRLRERPGMLQARLPDGEVAEASDGHTSLGFIPIGMGYARAITDRLSLGGGFYLRERDLFETRATLSLDPESFDGRGPDLPLTSFGLSHQRWKMDFGFALGWQVTPTLRLGVGVWGNLFIATTEATVLHHRPEEDWGGPSADGAHLELQRKSYAVQGFALFGLQWRFADSWYLGVVYRTAEAALWRRDDLSSRGVFETLRPLFDQVTTRRVLAEDESEPLIETVSPPRLRLAVAYRGSRGGVAVEGDLSLPHRDEARGYDEGVLWNVRLGGTFSFTERLAVGGGFFTANSTHDGPDGVVRPSIDTYGITLGLNFRARHEVRGREDPLTFSTTMAARYALSVVEATGLSYDPLALDEGYQRGEEREVMFWDLAWFFGTAILF